MKHLLLTLLVGAALTMTALDAAAQGGRGGAGGRGGFPGNNNGGFPTPDNGAAPPAASALPTAPPGAFAPAPATPTTALPQTGFVAAPANATPKPATPAASATPAATPAAAQGGSATARAKNTTIQVVDDKISMEATAVPLGQLVKLLDAATGKSSRVKKDPAVEDKKVSVRFKDLAYEDAVRKIFQGVALDFIVVDDGVIVTAVTGAVASTTAAAAARPAEPPQPTGMPGPPVLGADPGGNIFSFGGITANPEVFPGAQQPTGGAPQPAANPAQPFPPVQAAPTPPIDLGNPFATPLPFGNSPNAGAPVPSPSPTPNANPGATGGAPAPGGVLGFPF